MHIPNSSVEEKVRVLIAELKNDLASIDTQEELNVISKRDAASIRKSIQQSIDDLAKIPRD